MMTVLAYVETVLAVVLGVALLILGSHIADSTIHDGGVLVLGSAARSLVGQLGTSKS